MATPTKATQNKDGTRTPTQTRNQITSPVITFHNHIDLKTGEPAYGRWAMGVWQKQLRQVIAQRNHVIVTPVEEKVANKKSATVNYGRAATLTGSKTGIDATLKEYDREQAAIYMAARNAYAAAATAEAGKDEKIVMTFNPNSLDWTPYWNSYGLGAVRAYCAANGVDPEFLPKARHTETAAVGEAYKTGKVPPPAKKAAPAEAEKPKTAAKSAAKGATKVAPKPSGRAARRQRAAARTEAPKDQPQPLAETLAQHTPVEGAPEGAAEGEGTQQREEVNA